MTRNNRKPILGDDSIIWPGENVKIISSGIMGTILQSKFYGKVYEIKLESGEIATVNKEDIEEIK